MDIWAEDDTKKAWKIYSKCVYSFVGDIDLMKKGLRRSPFQNNSLLLTSQVVQHEAITRLIVEKGIFTREEFLERVKVVDREMRKIK